MRPRELIGGLRAEALPIAINAQQPSLAIATAALFIFCGPSAYAQTNPKSVLQQIKRNDLCVTNGTVSILPGGRLAIATPSSRAVIRAVGENTADQFAEIRFRYIGPTQTAKLLASGELRRQIGLKLRTEDSCNLIYAMWHIEPDTVLAVSIKRNAGLHTHEQCGAGGYVNIRPQRRVDLPPIRPGETHTLRAELHRNFLTVLADGKMAWQGMLGDEPPPLKGPTGFRTDNARFQLEYYGESPPKSPSRMLRDQNDPGRCVTSEGD